MNILNFLKNYFRLKIYAPFRINKHASFYSSHSQFGEDMVLRSIFGNKMDGTYIDLGAHHPVYYSNTYHFYRKGWRGINIDAIPGSMKLFNQFRPNDKNIEACIDREDNKEITFYEFTQSAFNTIDAQMAEEAIKKGNKVINKHLLKTKSLQTIIQEAGIDANNVDLFTIDIEGLDQIVLRENDWNKFKPRVIAFEDHTFDINAVQKCETLNFLISKGYEFKSKCGPTIIVEKVPKSINT